MKRRTHGGEEGYLLILPVFGDAKFFLAQIGNIVSFSGDGDNGNSDQICIGLEGFDSLRLFGLSFDWRWFSHRLAGKLGRSWWRSYRFWVGLCLRLANTMTSTGSRRWNGHQR